MSSVWKAICGRCAYAPQQPTGLSLADRSFLRPSAWRSLGCLQEEDFQFIPDWVSSLFLPPTANRRTAGVGEIHSELMLVQSGSDPALRRRQAVARYLHVAARILDLTHLNRRCGAKRWDLRGSMWSAEMICGAFLHRPSPCASGSRVGPTVIEEADFLDVHALRDWTT